MNQQWILLVEDDEDEAELTLRAFRKARSDDALEVARDGVEALEMLQVNGKAEAAGRQGLPNVVLLDLKLPRIDGLTVLRRIRSEPRTHLLPVVVLTSSREEQDLIESYELGANSYVRKPVDFGQLLMASEQFGQYWLDLNETPPGDMPT